jgi:hypothetical protein
MNRIFPADAKGALAMDNETMDNIRERIIRYVDEYGWNWVTVRKQINAYFGTALSAEQLRKIYKLSKAARP